MKVQKSPLRRRAGLFWAFLCAGMIVSGCSNEPDPMQQKKAELEALIQKNIGQLKTKEIHVTKLRQPFQKSIDFFYDIKALHKEHCGEEFDDAFIGEITTPDPITIDSINTLTARTHRRFMIDEQAIRELREVNEDIMSFYNSLKAEEEMLPEYFEKLRAYQRLLEGTLKRCYEGLPPQEQQKVKAALGKINREYRELDSVYAPLIM